MFPEIVGRVCIEAAIQSVDRRPLPAQLVTPHAVLTAESLSQFYKREKSIWQLNWQAVRERLTVPLSVDRTSPNAPLRHARSRLSSPLASTNGIEA